VESNGKMSGWNPDSFQGTQLGSCLLEEPLSIGSMGAVFLARQERPHRYVAVKVIHRHLASDHEAWNLFLARFQREADATAALDHANIVPIYEFGETGDLAYLVMPYLPDGSLATRLEQHGPLPLPQTLLAIEQVAAALDYAHARGIVHRDVKPSNMLLHPDGRVLLADFGIARPLYLPDLNGTPTTGAPLTDGDASLTQAGSSMGTPEFMAPEQVRGGPITPATDTYALGIATYELLGGRTPFGGADVPTVLRRQLVAPPPPLRSLRTDLPARVEEVVFWALAKDPADRPASASDFAKALRAATRKNTLVAGALWLRQAQSRPIGPRGPVSRDVLHETGGDRRFPELTLPLPHRVRPDSPAGELEAPAHQSNGEDSSVTAGPAGINIGPVLGYPGGGAGGGYTPGAPQWPAPERGPNKRVAIAAIAGLCIAIATVIILGALLASTVQSLLTNSTGSVSGSPGVSGQHAATALPSPTQVPPTATPTPPTNWLVVDPTQIALSCGSKQTLQLTNVGPETVHWAAQPNSPIVILSQTSGTLHSGDSRSITVSLRFKVNLGNEGGTILFTVTNQQAGDPAQVTYSTSPCAGG
jgi:serine/threonine protein kinase